MAPLDGAVALAEVDAVPVAVDRDLDLDVAVLVEPLLEVQRVVAERRLGLRAADLEHRFELARGADHAHALAAAAGRRLDQDRVAQLLGLRERVRLVAEHPVRARDRGQAVRAEQPAGGFLVSEPLEHRAGRADERQAVGARRRRRSPRPRTGSRSPGGSRRSRSPAPPRSPPAPRGTSASRRPGRCRSPRPRAGPAASRGPPRCRRRPPRRRAPGTPAGCAARSRRGWR